MKGALCLLGLIMFCVGCSDDDMLSKKDSEIVDAKLLLKEMYVNDFLSEVYEYNSDNLLLKVTKFSGPDNVIQVIDYDYNDNEVLISYTNFNSTQQDDSYKFITLNDSLGRIERYNYLDELTSTNYQYFNENPCGTVGNVKLNNGNLLEFISRNVFVDDFCSFQRIRINSIGEEYVSLEVTKNEKFNAHSSTRLMFSRISKNRCVTNIQAFTEDGDIHDSSYESSFEYNQNSYPTKEIRTHLAGDVYVYDFYYY